MCLMQPLEGRQVPPWGLNGLLKSCVSHFSRISILVGKNKPKWSFLRQQGYLCQARAAGT